MPKKGQLPIHMIKAINRYYNSVIQSSSGDQKKREIQLIIKSVNIFLKYLHARFKKAFWAQLDLDLRKNQKLIFKEFKTLNKINKPKEEVNNFSNYILKNYRSYYKIFLSRDAYLPYQYYLKNSQRDDALEVLFTRKRLLGRNNGLRYLSLVNLSYKDIFTNQDLDTFISRYMQNLKKHVLYKTIVSNTHDILHQANVFKKVKPGTKILLIDTGIQGGLILPLYTYLKDLGFEVDFFLYTCVAWIYPFFKNNVFSKDVSFLEVIERKSVKAYEKKH